MCISPHQHLNGTAASTSHRMRAIKQANVMLRDVFVLLPALASLSLLFLDLFPPHSFRLHVFFILLSPICLSGPQGRIFNTVSLFQCSLSAKQCNSVQSGFKPILCLRLFLRYVAMSLLQNRPTIFENNASACLLHRSLLSIGT